PSLAQIYYNLRFTSFVDAVLNESLLAANNSPVTKAFGIQSLKEEESFNASLGFTFSSGPFSATIDGYLITIEDRIILTNNFDATSLGIGVQTAQFFTNGVDTESLGLDIVLSYKMGLGNGDLTAYLAGNLNKLEVTNVSNGDLDAQTFFGDRGRSLLEDAAPSSKFSLSLGYKINKLSANVSATNFGAVSYLGFGEDLVNYDSRTTVDANVTLKLTKGLDVTLGGNNIFNIYPTQQLYWETDNSGYWDSVQMGFGGTYYYARLGFGF
ncbi:MAG: TonB-dependent receptor, partial [Chitinophagales bacterium]